MRRNWNALSPAYRARLERGGLTKRSYESGTPLAAVRGHAATPERPTRGKDKPEYAAYHRRRQTLVDKVQRMKLEAFGNRPRWNPGQSRRNVEKASMAKLENIASYDSIDDYWNDQEENEQYDATIPFYH